MPGMNSCAWALPMALSDYQSNPWTHPESMEMKKNKQPLKGLERNTRTHIYADALDASHRHKHRAAQVETYTDRKGQLTSFQFAWFYCTIGLRFISLHCMAIGFIDIVHSLTTQPTLECLLFPPQNLWHHASPACLHIRRFFYDGSLWFTAAAMKSNLECFLPWMWPKAPWFFMDFAVGVGARKVRVHHWFRCESGTVGQFSSGRLG